MKEKNNKKFEFNNVLTVSFGHLVHDIHSAFLAPILPLLIDKFGFSMLLAGLLDVFRKIPSLMNPFIGLLADKISLRYFVIFSPLITAITMCLLGVVPNYAFVAILVTISGVSSAIFHVPSPVMIKHLSHNQIGKGMSFYMFGGEMARTLGPLTILGAVSLWGLEGSFRLLPISLIATLILYFRLHNISIKQDFKKKKSVSTKKTFSRLIPFFLAISGFIFARAAMKSALTIYLPTYLTSKGSSLWMAGISLSILQFSGAGGVLIAGIISDKIGRKKALLIIAIINPILMWLFVILDGIMVIPILIATGFFLFASGPVLLAIIHDIKSERMSFINSIYMTISFLISSVMVVLVGLASDRIGMDLTYKITAIIAIAAIPSVLFLKTREDMPENPDNLNITFDYSIL